MNGPAEDVGDAAGWRSAATLALYVLVAIALLGAVQRLTSERIATARTERLAATLAAVLPATAFDNEPARDRVLVEDTALGDGGARPVYRVRRAERPVGAVLSVVAPDGYAGPIELLVGVRVDGRVSGVRVVEHRETPGLGDRIERRRSDWITTFAGRSLADGRGGAGDAPGWQVVRGGRSGRDGHNARADGRDIGEYDTDEHDTGEHDTGEHDGTFDALTGATITSRAVVHAVHRALVWFARQRDAVLAP